MKPIFIQDILPRTSLCTFPEEPTAERVSFFCCWITAKRVSLIVGEDVLVIAEIEWGS